MSYDLVPGDQVRFRNEVWEVFVSPKVQNDLSPIAIFKYETPGRASAVQDLIRPRCDLTLITNQQAKEATQ
jgi:hypothetical protein